MPDCPACGTTTETERCPDCGAVVAAGQTPSLREFAVGFLAGVVAFVLGFVGTALLSDARESREAVENLLGPDGPPGVALSELLPEWYHVLSWELLENHQVAISARAGDLFGGGVASEYIETLLPGPSAAQILPPVLLVGAGVLVASRNTHTGPAESTAAGATVAVGYLPGIATIAAVTTFEVTLFGATLVEIEPDVLKAVLIAGISYPVFFGGVGGLCAFGLARVWNR